MLYPIKSSDFRHGEITRMIYYKAVYSFTHLKHFFILQDPKERLGCHPQTGFADIQGHPFFRNVDWDMVCNFYCFSMLGQILLS